MRKDFLQYLLGALKSALYYKEVKQLYVYCAWCWKLILFCLIFIFKLMDEVFLSQFKEG